MSFTESLCVRLVLPVLTITGALALYLMVSVLIDTFILYGLGNTIRNQSLYNTSGIITIYEDSKNYGSYLGAALAIVIVEVVKLPMAFGLLAAIHRLYHHNRLMSLIAELPPIDITEENEIELGDVDDEHYDTRTTNGRGNDREVVNFDDTSDEDTI